MGRFLVVTAILLIFIASQLFWIRRVGEWSKNLIPNEIWRRVLRALGVVFFVFVFAYNLAWAQRGPSPTSLSLAAALLEAPFRWWLVGSMLGFAIASLFGIADRLGRGLFWSYRKLVRAFAADQPEATGSGVGSNALPADPPSLGRRRFLGQTAVAVSATPFIAAAYGLLYERLDVQTTRQRIKLARLPRAFDGFRIVQLSDLHIGPFMSAREIRKCAAIANQLKPDLMVLTGDFVTWDATTQEFVVQALSGLHAPFGVFGCLGNHEMWTDTEDSITRLFAATGVRILRLEQALIQTRGETLNLIGVDYQTRRHMGRRGEGLVTRYLEGVERLVRADTANILLSHNPNTFDRAAELGIDLSLAGHTHGGQVTLEFIHPDLSPARLITDYVRGWFQKPGGQLYVNRGIGTIGVPIRIDSPPEITLFELTRQA
jgi:predicted MPP superfamily phosphohydrolase